MRLYKTKEAAHSLGVSATTVKRWASSFPGRYRKDSSGHYIFTSEDMASLTHIKRHLDAGAHLHELNPQPETIQEETVRSLLGTDDGRTTAGVDVRSCEETSAPASTVLGRAVMDAAVRECAASSYVELGSPVSSQIIDAMPNTGAGNDPASGMTGSGSDLSYQQAYLWETLQIKLDAVEKSLSRKAGDVVSFQVLEHRKELDEIRSVVRELACSVESVTETLSALQKTLNTPAPEPEPFQTRTQTKPDAGKRKIRFGAWFPF